MTAYCGCCEDNRNLYTKSRLTQGMPYTKSSVVLLTFYESYYEWILETTFYGKGEKQYYF